MQILVDGTIAPWLFNGNYYQGPLIDPGIFGPAGLSLTGDAIHITWNSDPFITAAITIEGTTITLSGGYTVFQPDYQNITVQPGRIAVNSYDPIHGIGCNPRVTYCNPNGIGGALHLNDLDGYFYVTSMTNPDNLAAVPGPVAGEGLAGLLIALLVGVWWRTASRQTL